MNQKQREWLDTRLSGQNPTAPERIAALCALEQSRIADALEAIRERLRPLPRDLEDEAIHHRPEPVEQLSPAEALYGFASWLMTLQGKLEVGSSCDAAPMAVLVDEYVRAQQLEPLRHGWTTRLRQTPSPVVADGTTSTRPRR